MNLEQFPLDPRSYVRQELELRKMRRPQYSLRAFARDLEMSPSFLCEFLAGRQGFSKARALWVAERIKLTEAQRDHFWDLIESQFGQSDSLKKAAQMRVTRRTRQGSSKVSLEKFRLLANWYHFAILELFDLDQHSLSLEDIAKHLRLPLEEVIEAVERLKALGFLESIEDGGQTRLKPVSDATLVGEDTSERAIQIAHQQALAWHSEAVDSKPFSERENLTMAASISQADWLEMRKEVQNSILNIVTKYASRKSKKDQVVSLTFQIVTLVPTEPKP